MIDYKDLKQSDNLIAYMKWILRFNFTSGNTKETLTNSRLRKESII